MKSDAIVMERAPASSSSAKLGPSFIWLIPLLYPLALLAIDRSADLVRDGAVAGGVLLFAAAMSWALAGPFAAWLAIDHLDRNGLERREHRFAVYGALLTAATPPLYIFLATFLGWFNERALRLPILYLVFAVVAVAAFLPAEEPKVAPVALRRLHGYAAMLIVLFAVVHILNNLLAIDSLDVSAQFMRVFRLVYRERLIEIALVAAVALQVITGFTMVWKSRMRRTTTFRNLQTVSGIYLVTFFFSHLSAPFTARLHGVDTNFTWATNGPVGLLAHGHSAATLPYYILGVVMLFVHLACQARRNLARVVPDSAARKLSYSLMALGGLVAVVIAMAACGIHLRS